MGDDVGIVKQLADKSHKFWNTLSSAKRPLVIIGTNQLNRPDGAGLLATVQKLSKNLSSKIEGAPEWKVLNVLQTAASQVAALDIGYKAGVDEIKENKPEILFLLGADEGLIKRDDLAQNAFVIYQGHHGDTGAAMADCVLPGAAYTEKQGSYVNTEGRAQQTLVAVTPPGLGREDWKIIRAISELVGKKLPYDSLLELRNRLEQISPTLTSYGVVQPANFFDQALQLAEVSGSKKIESMLE